MYFPNWARSVEGGHRSVDVKKLGEMGRIWWRKENISSALTDLRLVERNATGFR